MKDLKCLQHLIDGMLARSACRYLAGTANPFPYEISLGKPTKDQLASIDSMSEATAEARRIYEYAKKNDLECISTNHGRGKASTKWPSKIFVADFDTAMRSASEDVSVAVRCLADRCDQLKIAFPDLSKENIEAVLSGSRQASEQDFGLLLSAGLWFQDHDSSGMAFRSVPIPGFSGKWLEKGNHEELVCLLSGKNTLGLCDMPKTFEMRYLDHGIIEERRRCGVSEYALWAEGKLFLVPSGIDEVWVVENKATFLSFPERSGAVVIYGSGKAGVSAIAAANWISQLPFHFYWGDMDADGLEILNAYRKAGYSCQSVLMDIASYRIWEPYGTNISTSKTELADHKTADISFLEDAEADLYRELCNPASSAYRRVEQEKIPFSYAVDYANSLRQVYKNSNGRVSYIDATYCNGSAPNDQRSQDKSS